MRIEIKKEDTEKYNIINNNVARERDKIGDLLIYYEKEKKNSFDKLLVLQQDLQNCLINIMRKYKLHKQGIEIKDVNIEEGYIEIIKVK